LGITAQGLQTLELSSLDEALQHIAALARDYGVERVIIGNPVGHRSGQTEMSRRVAVFAQKLGHRLECPVELWDERLTSAQARRVLREANVGMRTRKLAVDRIAATLLLQSYLDFQANQAQRSAGAEQP